MSPAPKELTARPLRGPQELELFCRLSYVLDDELAEDLESGRRRPEWMWVALRGERVVARIAWWSRDGEVPLLLDFFDLDDTLPEPERGEAGLRLLEEATAAVVPEGPRGPSTDGSCPPTGARTRPPAMSWRPGSG